MRIGFIGPAGDTDLSVLREATEFLLGDANAEQAIYLGEDGAADRLAEIWMAELQEGAEGDFLASAAALAVDGSPTAIESLLEREEQARRLSRLRTLPPAPARAVEMMEDRILLAVHDKSILDEEDIANASVIVYGRSQEALLKRFGPRYFFTPGPLSGGTVGLFEADDEGRISVAAYAPTGEPLWREVLQGRRSKVSVSR